MTKCLTAAALVCWAFTLPPVAGAQLPRRALGFWVGVGGGIGPGAFDCDICVDPEGRSAPTGMIALGRTLSNNMAVGLEVSGWRKRADAAVEHLGYAMATYYLFPLPRSGLHLEAGIGVARGTSEIARSDGAGTNRASTLSPGWRVGAGFDVPIGREISITPLLGYFMGLGSELEIDGSPTGVRVANHLFQLGVGLHWNFSGDIGVPHPTAP